MLTSWEFPIRTVPGRLTCTIFLGDTMKKLVIGLLLIGACAASAGTIIDLQMGAYTVGDEVTVTNAVVTGVRYNGMCINEDPNGPYTGVWVYTGAAPAAAVGDLVEVKGLYEEYYDFTEINVTTDMTGYVTNLGPHTGALYPIELTLAAFNADPEPYEGCFVKITSGMVVTSAPSTYGEWTVESFEDPGEFLIMDDYWYDDTTVLLGDCYNCATGIITYSFGTYRLEPFADAICVVDCAVPNQVMSFGQVKSLYK